MDKENSLTEDLAECRAQEEDISNNQISNLEKASEEILQEYNDNLQKCKVGHICPNYYSPDTDIIIVL